MSTEEADEDHLGLGSQAGCSSASSDSDSWIVLGDEDEDVDDDGCGSVTSDGIPIHEDGRRDDQPPSSYFWHSEFEVEKADEAISLNRDDEETTEDHDDDDDDDDDLEIVNRVDVEEIVSREYPTEELPEEFAEATIERGRTYNHQRNQVQ